MRIPDVARDDTWFPEPDIQCADPLAGVHGDDGGSAGRATLSVRAGEIPGATRGDVIRAGRQAREQETPTVVADHAALQAGPADVHDRPAQTHASVGVHHLADERGTGRQDAPLGGRQCGTCHDEDAKNERNKRL